MEEGTSSSQDTERQQKRTVDNRLNLTARRVEYQPKVKIPRIPEHLHGRSPHSVRIPIIRPKMPPKPTGAAVRLITTPPPIAPSVSNPRPLISLLDRTEFRDRNRVVVPVTPNKPKKLYYTELNEIRKEFGIPEAFDAAKPNTMSGVALAEKLQMVQRLRGENKFLRESIEKKNEMCQARTEAIEQLQRTTADTLGHCQVLRETLNQVVTDTERIRNQMR
ncbi:unnamed protein product [Caenorhabditis sp. 36 PRJEB53466]|nr:unnamed protein product [Caenorhabditis sp. 36 PRJEB53466]